MNTFLVTVGLYFPNVTTLSVSLPGCFRFLYEFGGYNYNIMYLYTDLCLFIYSTCPQSVGVFERMMCHRFLMHQCIHVCLRVSMCKTEEGIYKHLETVRVHKVFRASQRWKCKLPLRKGNTLIAERALNDDQAYYMASQSKEFYVTKKNITY